MIRVCALFFLASTLVACGGGGGSEPNSDIPNTPSPVGGDPAPSGSQNNSSTIEGRVVDGPLSGARVFLDLNGNLIQDANEISVVTDANGFFEFPANTDANIQSDKLVAVGGTDTSTGKSLPNMVLVSDIPTAEDASVVVTPVSTLIAAATTSADKQAVLTSLGITGSVEEVLTQDSWAQAQLGNQQAIAVQAANQAIAAVLQSATSLIDTSGSDSTSNAANLIMSISEQLVTESVAESYLFDETVLADVMEQGIEDYATDYEPSLDLDSQLFDSVASTLSTTIGIIQAADNPTSAAANEIVATVQETLQIDIAEVASSGNINNFISSTEPTSLFSGAGEEALAIVMLDTDGDGIVNTEDSDMDNDGLPNFWELQNGRDPLIADYQIGMGQQHACALDDSGVSCWSPSSGDYRTVPPELINPSKIDVGWNHTCVIDDTGVVCWGSNGVGQTAVPALSNPTYVAAGASHSCAIDDTGVVCWGDNSKGQITVPALTNPRRIDLGVDLSCAIDDTGVVCWGDNAGGGTDVPSLSNPRHIDVGRHSACAIDDTGVVCWGDIEATLKQREIPELINPRQVVVNKMAVCALDDQGVICWGEHRLPFNSLEIIKPTQISVDPDEHTILALDNSGLVCPANSLNTWACPDDLMFDPDSDGVSNSQDIFPFDPTEWFDTDNDGMGNNADADDDGDGINDLLDSDIDNDGYANDVDMFPVDPSEHVDTDQDGLGNNADSDDDGDGIADSDDAFPLDAREYLDTDNDGLGNNADTDDDGDGVSDDDERMLDTDMDSLPNDWEAQKNRDPLIADYQMGMGMGYACVLDDRGVTCWGVESESEAQTDVPELTNPRKIAIGPMSACAINDTGVVCWGDNSYDQTNVPTLLNPTQIAVGWNHTCAIDDNGINCWGDNSEGQTNIPPLVNPEQVVAGYTYSCALDDTGVVCWGDSSNKLANVIGVTNVPSLSNPTLIAAGPVEICAIDDFGITCWGTGGKRYIRDAVNPRQMAVSGNYICALDDTGVICSEGTLGISRIELSELNNPAQISLSPYGWNAIALDSTGFKCGYWADSLWPLTCDSLNFDPDGDGVVNGDDVFPLDSTESIDTDNDGIGNNADTDDDGDGISDSEDAFPLDPSGSLDADSDGISDSEDAFPLDPSESLDTDNDGIGNNADTDDDGDGLSDLWEIENGEDPLVSSRFDFEHDNSVTLHWRDIGGPNGDLEPGVLSSVVPDPAQGGTRGMVAKSSIEDLGQSWAGAHLVIRNTADNSLAFKLNLAEDDAIVSIDIFGHTQDQKIRLKLEDATDPNKYVSAIAYTQGDGTEWETLYFDFSYPVEGVIDPAVDYSAFFLMYGGNTADKPAATWYWDNITHVKDGSHVTPIEDPWVGTWKLNPVEGAIGVGPGQGSTEWWSNGEADITTRACLFDDMFYMGADGTFRNIMGDSTWLMPWQGTAAEQCGTPVAPHDGTIAATYVYDEDTSTITVTGEGAHLGLAKVVNGCELGAEGCGTDAPASRTYTVSQLAGDGSSMTVQIQAGTSDGYEVWWQFRFVKVVNPLVGAWKLAPEAQAMGIGSTLGDISWWSNTEADVATRSCLFNDIFYLGADFSFANIQGASTWLDATLQAVNEDSCGAPIAPHNGSANATATYSYDATAGTLTINGEGSHIGLAKVTNQGETGIATGNTITYTVSTIASDGNAMTLDIEAGSGVWWRFKLVKADTAVAGKWKLKPVAGALSSGPSAGSSEWWSNSEADIETRACLFDDIFNLSHSTAFSNHPGEQTWLETWQGAAEESCGTPVAPHDGSGSNFQWHYDLASKQLVLEGQGAHVGLPEVVNDCQLGNSADGCTTTAPDSVTYTVKSLNADKTEMELHIEAGKESDVWWKFILEKE